MGQDFLVSQANRIPFPIGITLFAMAAILFLLFGSVVLPVKAVLMNLLSLSGQLRRAGLDLPGGPPVQVLLVRAARVHDRRQPIIMFCVLFGLSMDYEVLLLSRIQEAYLPRRQHARRSPRAWSAPAGSSPAPRVIMVTVFAAFAMPTSSDQERSASAWRSPCARRDDRAGAAGPGHDAPAGRLELVGPRSARAVRGAARLQPRRGRGDTGTRARSVPAGGRRRTCLRFRLGSGQATPPPATGSPAEARTRRRAGRRGTAPGAGPGRPSPGSRRRTGRPGRRRT